MSRHPALDRLLRSTTSRFWRRPIRHNLRSMGFYPTNIVNTAAFWNYRDLPIGTVNAWTDEMPASIVWTNWATTYVRPTNTGMGVFFYNSGMTNDIFSTKDNFSIWMVLAMANNPTNYAQMMSTVAEHNKPAIHWERRFPLHKWLLGRKSHFGRGIFSAVVAMGQMAQIPTARARLTIRLYGTTFLTHRGRSIKRGIHVRKHRRTESEF